MDFNKIDKETKRFITLIVDDYVYGKQNITNGSNPYLEVPGVPVREIFKDVNNNIGIFNILLHRDDNSNVELHYIFEPSKIKKMANDGKYDAEFRFIKTKRAEFFYKISVLKWLLEAGYIFLVDNKDLDLFNKGGITSHDYQRWEKNGITCYKETIKSKTLFEFISEYNNCIIIPSPQLIDLRNNKFKTPEETRFIKTQRVSWCAIGISLLIAVTSPLLNNSTHTKIEKGQFDAIINAIQDANHSKHEGQPVDSIYSISNIKTQHNA